MCLNRCGNDASGLDPRADVSHEISVYPVDDACIDVSDLEQGRHLWVSGTMTRLLVPTEISYWCLDASIGQCETAICLIIAAIAL